MDPLLYYLLQVNVGFLLPYGTYHFLFRNTALFAANRAWLLLAPVAALLMPLVPLPASAPISGIIELMPLKIVGADQAPMATPSMFTPMKVLYGVYLAGVFLSLLILAIRYIQAWRSSRRAGDEAMSFFGRIVIPVDVEGAEERSLIAHEHAHVEMGHSYDVLFYEVLATLSWWNPLWRLALRELRIVHELQADAVASTFHPDYGRLLLSRALGVPASTLVNSFRSSNLKTRITMLNKTGSRSSGLKYAFAIPVLLGALIAVSCVRSDAPLPPSIAPTRSGITSQPITDLSQLDVQPQFPGGMEAMYAYLRENIHYPEDALRGSMTGTSIVEFTVGSDGKVKDVEMVRGPKGPMDRAKFDKQTQPVVAGLIRRLMHDVSLLDDEAVRVVASMPDWTPGQKDGHTVATRFTIPIAYKVDKAEAPNKE